MLITTYVEATLGCAQVTKKWICWISNYRHRSYIGAKLSQESEKSPRLSVLSGNYLVDGSNYEMVYVLW